MRAIRTREWARGVLDAYLNAYEWDDCVPCEHGHLHCAGDGGGCSDEALSVLNCDLDEYAEEWAKRTA
jgi:hypothetical protein